MALVCICVTHVQLSRMCLHIGCKWCTCWFEVFVVLWAFLIQANYFFSCHFLFLFIVSTTSWMYVVWQVLLHKCSTQEIIFNLLSSRSHIAYSGSKDISQHILITTQLTNRGRSRKRTPNGHVACNHEALRVIDAHSRGSSRRRSGVDFSCKDIWSEYAPKGRRLVYVHPSFHSGPHIHWGGAFFHCIVNAFRGIFKGLVIVNSQLEEWRYTCDVNSSAFRKHYYISGHVNWGISIDLCDQSGGSRACLAFGCMSRN